MANTSSGGREMIQTRSDGLAEKYTDMAVLRASVVAIPFVGSSIDALISGRAAKIANERLQATLSELRFRLEAIDERKLDVGFFETEKGADLFRQCLEVAVRTRTRERHRALAAVLVDGMRVDFQASAEPELLLSVISEISDEEIIVLHAAFDLVPYDPTMMVVGWADALERKVPPGLRPRLPFLVARLEGKGLLGDSLSGDRSGERRPTPVGRALVGYLSATSKNDSASLREREHVTAPTSEHEDPR